MPQASARGGHTIQGERTPIRETAEDTGGMPHALLCGCPRLRARTKASPPSLLNGPGLGASAAVQASTSKRGRQVGRGGADAAVCMARGPESARSAPRLAPKSAMSLPSGIVPARRCTGAPWLHAFSSIPAFRRAIFRPNMLSDAARMNMPGDSGAPPGDCHTSLQSL